jgi:hypothetical protein
MDRARNIALLAPATGMDALLIHIGIVTQHIRMRGNIGIVGFFVAGHTEGLQIG